MTPSSPSKWLAIAFVGMPGLILWGSAGCLALSLIGAMAFDGSDPRLVAMILASLPAALVGYLMMVASCLLWGGPRYRFPGKQLAAIMSLEIGSQVGFAFSFLSGIGWLGSYLDGNKLWQQAAYILGAIFFSFLTWALLESLRLRRTRCEAGDEGP